jgi:cytidylate kinase
MKSNIPVITIDGPGGSGKGTISQLVATDLHWHYLESGALYRVLALLALQKNIATDDVSTLTAEAEKIPLRFVTAKNQAPRVLLSEVDVTDEIHHESCGTVASKIAAIAEVRQALLERQRQFRQAPGLVTDGRDMGSIVFPDAQVKFFFIASPEERAHRRYKQLKEAGINVSLDALCEELIERDRRDQQRLVAPLKPTSDAIIIDTTGLSIAEVLQQVKAIVQQKGIT